MTTLKITPLDIEDERVHNKPTHSMDINIPQQENIYSNLGSQSNSPSTFDDHHTNPFHIHDDEDMLLGDEAEGNLVGNLSDEDGHVSRSVNVSPTRDDDSDLPELINQKPLQTPPITPLSKQNNLIDNSIVLFPTIENNERNSRSNIHHNQINDDHKDLYDSYHQPTISNHSSTNRHNTVSI